MKTSRERARDLVEAVCARDIDGWFELDFDAAVNSTAAAIDEAVGVEREACAKAAEDYDLVYGSGAAAALDVADKIRTRGKVG